MLEKLDSIRWKKLSHFRCNASNIPKAIRNLTSKERSVRLDAIWTLSEDLHHQGTVCETTALAVPFLIELLQEPEVEDKLNIVAFLSSITFESLFDYAHPAAVFFQSYSDEYVESIWWESACASHLVRSEVQKGSSVYQQLLLAQEQPFLRGAAAYLLGILTDCDDQNINWLRSQFATEQDEGVGAAIVLSVGLLSDDRPENTAWLQKIFDTETSLFLRINAAIGLARSIPQRVPEPVIDLLVDSIGNPSEVASMFDRYPWQFDSLLESEIMQYWCSIALNRVGRRSLRSLPTLINALAKVSHEVSYEIARYILNIIFDSEAMPDTLTVEQLSDEQRLGLEAIANSKQLWLGYSENYILYYVASMLQDFGLPTRPEKLQAFLAGELTLENCNGLDDIPF
ncbi:MAG: hypothetical protein KME17_12540 [Cyanosarcina radialis HA8281-LM2]|jgi:hypothetical protein|nr:hypothetical protein [Cyanosarcina radialis HA8281-LM2]